MDITIRKVNSDAFRKFKAHCAEAGVQMGDGFGDAVLAWLGNSQFTTKNIREHKQNLHTLNDLGAHLHAMQGKLAAAPRRKGKRK